MERQFKYKTQKLKSRLIQVDRFYPSSQLCPVCQAKHKMPLSGKHLYMLMWLF
ncbi:transposase [Microseira wollei]|uniref:transposase n=1 Tax=Microseira wollei TaxID=467598 RepID=UPI001CFCDE29